MGRITMGVPKDITLFFKNNFNCTVFIETGTYMGITALWAAEHFEKVYTIEFSGEIFEATSKKYAHINNIDFCFGDTRNVLEEIVPKNEDKNPVFWLDAHWSSGNTYGENDQCPLIDELNILNKSNKDMFILIDDARLFLSPPPLPHSLAQYPDILEIVKKLSEKERFVAIYNDVIFAIPSKYKMMFSELLQSKANDDLIREVSDSVKTPVLKKIVQKVRRLINV